MELTDFFTRLHTDNIVHEHQKLIDSQTQEKGAFRYIIEERGCKLTIEYFPIVEEGRLSLNMFFSPRQHSIGEPLILNFNSDVMSWIPDHSETKVFINLEVEKIGFKSQSHGIHISCSNQLELNVSLMNCRSKDVGIEGHMNLVKITGTTSHRLTITGKFKNVLIDLSRPLNEKSTMGFYHCQSDFIRMTNIRSISEIELKEVRFEVFYAENISGKKLELTGVQADNLRLAQCNLDLLSFEGLKSEGGKLSITDSQLEEVKFRDIHFTYIPKGRFTNFLSRIKSKPYQGLSILYAIKDIKQVSFSNVEWSYHSILDDFQYKGFKRDFIIRTKQYYARVQDITNEKLFKSFEKIWYFKNRGWSLPLSLSYYSNRFGLSVVRPFCLVLVAILIQSIIFYIGASCECRVILLENWGVASNLLNPTHRTSIFIDLLEPCNPNTQFINLITLIDNLFRLLIGYLIFQFIDAFRYKYNLGK